MTLPGAMELRFTLSIKARELLGQKIHVGFNCNGWIIAVEIRKLALAYFSFWGVLAVSV